MWLHADQSLLTTWQQPVLGFICSFIGARTVVKGTAFHAQRLIIKERLEAGHTRPAWWMPIFPFLRWRFDWDRAHWHGELEHNQHTALHRALLALAILAFAFLAYEGWHILTYFNAPWE